MENIESNPSPSIEDGKTIAIISYLTLIGLIVALVMNSDKKNDFASYHIRQSFGIMVTGVALGVLNMIPFLGWLVFLAGSVFVFIMWVTGLLNALGGKAKPVVGLGEKFQEWFVAIK